ncbi:MAG: 16S rRNA (guanine(527)-N(7))-methyltransferase RsmG [candidate division WOR-3 bacterium]
MLSTDHQWSDFAEWCKKLGVNLTQDQLNKFQTYQQLLLDWNQKINLISRKDIGRIVSYHFIDSISAINEISNDAIVSDLGTGAGLPGIPIKILRNDITIYLVESIKKKANFLSETIKTLGLNNTLVFNQRAETIRKYKFDIILVRLLGKISEILPLADKLLINNGKIIFYKTAVVEEEIEQTKKISEKYNFVLTKIKTITLPITEIRRKLVIYQKL